MVPRNRRPKVGLTRMHAALDAMRPMGFSPDVVRKSVKNLLRVYGDDGWAFIEDAAYKLLIDTILEEPEQPNLEGGTENLLLKAGGAQDSIGQPKSVPELCDKEVICDHKVFASDKEIKIQQEKHEEPNLDVEITSTSLTDKTAQHNDGVLFGFAPAYTPQPIDSIPTNRKHKPCYGWISEDEDDDFLQLTPAN